MVKYFSVNHLIFVLFVSNFVTTQSELKIVLKKEKTNIFFTIQCILQHCYTNFIVKHDKRRDVKQNKIIVQFWKKKLPIMRQQKIFIFQLTVLLQSLLFLLIIEMCQSIVTKRKVEICMWKITETTTTKLFRLQNSNILRVSMTKRW